MSETLEKKQPLPWWRRILLALVLLAMVPLAALMVAGYLVERQMTAEIVNISQAAEPITFADLYAGPDRGSTTEDAARYYDEVLNGIRLDALEKLIRVNAFYRKNIISLPASQFPAEVRKKITENMADFQPVLENLDKGAALPLSHFDIGIEQGMQVCKTRLRRVQTAIFLLSLRTLDLLLRGEDDQAVNSAISTLKMIRAFDTYPTILLYAAKAVSVGLACNDIFLLLQYAHPSEKSLPMLQEVLSQTIPANVLERIFCAERVYQIEIARNLMPENIISQFLQDKVPDLRERLSMPATRWGRLRMQQKSVQFFHDMAWLITAARRPWPEPLDTIAGDRPESTEKPSSILSAAAASVRLTAENLAFVRCTILAIAIERYRRSHGELPGSLDDLLPAYLDSVPLDPFTGKKLLYSSDGETYVVYSAGTNRQDDGGSLIRQAHGTGPQDYGFRIRFRETE